MSRIKTHKERHLIARIGWLRAAVLGANDGIVSTASLIVGVAAAAAGRSEVLVAGVAGLVAGAMSMAAGEYVSDSPEAELRELTQIYVERGLDRETARQVAEKLTANDALAAHARDELGISEAVTARPIQAAFTSAATFSVGALLPLLVVIFSPMRVLVPIEAAASLLFLALLGAVGAATGGGGIARATVRVTFWGAFAMALTAAIGKLVGTVV